jgi:uncharacterized RDD family membrane protein YckC
MPVCVVTVSMNPPDSDQSARYCDLEEPDMSEEEFSASLETSFERPQFVVDVSGEKERVPFLQDDTAETKVVGTPESIAEPQVVAQIAEQILDIDVPRASLDDWRNQVSAKVNSYKARKPQKDRYQSMRLPFEPQTRERSTASFVQSFSPIEAETARTEWRAPEPLPAVVFEATRVIEFPRSSAAPVSGDELADPVIDRPRIVEAPDLLLPPPALGGILIEPVQLPEPERRPGFEIPLQPAPFSRRLVAGGIDVFVVTVALVAFGYVFFRITGTTLQWKHCVEVATTLFCVLWPTYQYAFLVFSGTTPGLRLAKLRVNRFDGTPASRSLRRWRVLASLLSCVSLGLGYAWCFLDEDQLSWHDRITRTHLAPAN